MSSLRARLESESGRTHPNRSAAGIFAVLSAMALVVLDAAIVNVALPSIATSFDVTPADSVLVVTAYQLGLVVALLPSAALGESRGYRLVFRSGIALFTAASAACVFAPSFFWLVVARFAQGLGGAAVMSLGVALLRRIVAPERLGAAIGWNALTVALSSAAGPALGALVLSVLPWQWLFAINVPIGVLVLAVGTALPMTGGTRQKLEVISMLLNAVVFAAFVAAAELLATRPAFSGVLFIGMATGLTVLIRRERPRQAPLIPIDLLNSRSFRLSVAASVLCFAGQTAGMIALSFYLQHVLHQSPLVSGLVLTSWPLTVAITAPMTSRISEHLPGAWLCAAGGACLAAGLAGASLSAPNCNPFILLPFVVLCGLGFGLFQVPNNRNMFLAAPIERSGAAGGMQGTARLTGQTTGAVAMSVLFTLLSPDIAPQSGLAIGGMLTFAAGAVSVLRLSNSRTS